MNLMLSDSSLLGMRLRRLCGLVAAASVVVALAASSAPAAITWDGGGNSNWWFDPANWAFNMNDNITLPPASPTSSGDAQINIGPTGAWNVTGEGVVYDPVNDPFFDTAGGSAYPTGSPLATTAGVMRDYGPETLYRFYVSRNTPNTNLVTIKSGDLVIESSTIIGRSGSTAAAQNLGRVNQLGGSVRFPLIGVDIGQRETSGWGNGTYDYRGGTLQVSTNPNGPAGGVGIRLSHGGGNGTGGHGRFIMHNPASGGHVRAFDFVVASHGGANTVIPPDNPALDPDGVLTGVGIVEFHFANGGTRPIQVERNLSINNGLDSDLLGTRSSRLELVLDSAPTLTVGVPQNLGLFDVNFGGVFSGIISGTGDLDNDMVFNNDRVFSNAAGTTHYREGETVSAILGSTKYNWTISYTGDIAWTDADNSVVSAISGPGTGTDVVLMGLSSETVAADDADFDGDNDVDGADFLIWQRGLGVGTSNMTGDANGDGSVNAADLTIWRNQYGMTSAAGAAGAVPEPGAAALLVLGGLLLGGVRRRGW